MNPERGFLRSTFTTYLATFFALIAYSMITTDWSKTLAIVAAIIIIVWALINFVFVYFCNKKLSEWALKQLHTIYIGHLPIILAAVLLMYKFTSITDIPTMITGLIAIALLTAWFIWMLFISKTKP